MRNENETKMKWNKSKKKSQIKMKWKWNQNKTKKDTQKFQMTVKSNPSFGSNQNETRMKPKPTFKVSSVEKLKSMRCICTVARCHCLDGFQFTLSSKQHNNRNRDISQFDQGLIFLNDHAAWWKHKWHHKTDKNQRYETSFFLVQTKYGNLTWMNLKWTEGHGYSISPCVKTVLAAEVRDVCGFGSLFSGVVPEKQCSSNMVQKKKFNENLASGMSTFHIANSPSMASL